MFYVIISSLHGDQLSEFSDLQGAIAAAKSHLQLNPSDDIVIAKAVKKIVTHVSHSIDDVVETPAR